MKYTFHQIILQLKAKLKFKFTEKTTGISNMMLLHIISIEIITILLLLLLLLLLIMMIVLPVGLCLQLVSNLRRHTHYCLLLWHITRMRTTTKPSAVIVLYIYIPVHLPGLILIKWLNYRWWSLTARLKSWSWGV